jgi:hypothetical protein
MSYKAAFRWDKGDMEISFFCFDSSTFEIIGSAPRYIKIDDKVSANVSIQEFVERLRGIPEGGEIEYHILSENLNWDTMANPNILSEYISEQFKTACGSLQNWRIQQQCRGELTGEPLKTFKAALRNQGMADKANAWHLWSVGMHTTNGTVDIHVRKLWSVLKGISTRTKDGQKQYQEWLQQIQPRPRKSKTKVAR